MNSSIGNISLASKAQQIPLVSQNIQSSILIDQQASQQRNSSGGSQNNNSSSGGAGGGVRSQASSRNIQASKAKHKNHRKPSMQRDDVIAETIAMTSNSASRKGRTSITHLMDWSLPHPRPQHGHHPHSRGFHGNRRTPSWGQGSGYHAIDKARYVNANYRFIVDPTGDYRPQSLDPDSTLPWTSILQILASSITQSPSCPICLCDPVAPRMARCGHIFCFPCLIRYMASEDAEAQKQGQHFNNNQNKPKWKKCPICYDSIYMNEVRPVKFYTGQEVPAPREGEDVTLRLMMRQPGSTLALPKDVASSMPVLKRKGSIGDKKEEADSIPWYYAAEATDYARIMKGTREYLKEEYEREITDLEEQERVDELMFGDETDWVQKAIGKVKSAIEKTQELPEKGQEKLEKVSGRELLEKQLLEEAEARAELNKQREKIIQQTEVDVPEMYLMTSSSAQNGIGHEIHSPVDATIPQVETPTKPQAPAPRSPTRHRAPKPIDVHDPAQPYFFYQALPHSYLSPLDIRILKVAFGSFAAFPSSVLPRVENFSMGHVVDDELRKRAKYLSHLPYGCEVAFLECDWTDIVPADILEKFSVDLEKRRRKKKEKDNREERDRVRAEREEDEKRWSGARRSAPGRSESGAGEDELGLAMEISRREFETVAEEEDQDGGIVPNRPKFGFGSLPQSSPPNSRTVWGTPIVSGGEETPKQYSAILEEKKDVGWLEGWDKGVDAADQAAIAAAMASSSSGGAKGKKKFKKVTLMTNTGKRRA
ncbi:hypothetical protein TWF106_011031 [Orbilia oligospora]|uniref:RING-type domain-containing protein n=1 Tax=Orbilia oligospora TaxID=2813651 RepID=A0A6G1MF41_ORBOL|nr:hypothetical protein TWF106_011031 [Orbilia oligospora]KAF3225729.1 hypothetical protein TWF191_005075 [Orbilia oligospora]KAF3254900.1 hypothetical protein TWF192_002984 [Orbilia oligospora]